MKSSWINDMERITICIGLSIFFLGVFHITGIATIPPALVTGISISGFCLTLADFMSKLSADEGFSEKEKRSTDKIVFYLYTISAMGIVFFPNLELIKSLNKDVLDSMSTTASVIALGFVFIAIGENNRRAALKDQKELLQMNQNSVEITEKMLPELKLELQREKKEIAETLKENKELKKLLEECQKKLEQLEKDTK